MENEDKFYIGWQDNAPIPFRHLRKTFFILVLTLLSAFALTYVFIAHTFIASTFDYGQLTELEGRLVEYPVFGLKTQLNDKTVTVPLVGFGKFDALPILQHIKSSKKNVPIEKLKVTLKGTLIQYQDKTWMELTEGQKSIIHLTEDDQAVKQKVTSEGEQTIFGEVVDPKCFFGVMNPAYGKIHKSCAIRCISGGIPPILATRRDGEFVDYYFLLDQNHQPMNKAILQYVGMPVKLSGNVVHIDDWKAIHVDANNLFSSISVRLDENFALCL